MVVLPSLCDQNPTDPIDCLQPVHHLLTNVASELRLAPKYASVLLASVAFTVRVESVGARAQHADLLFPIQFFILTVKLSAMFSQSGNERIALGSPSW